jgi:WD40 repeat protein
VACTRVDTVPIAITAASEFPGGGGSSSEILVWDLRTGQRRQILAGHTQPVHTVACAQVDNVPIAITAAADEVLVWDLRTGQRRQILAGHTQPVRAVSCTEVDNVPIAIVTSGNELLISDLRTGQLRERLALPYDVGPIYGSGSTLIAGVAAEVIAFRHTQRGGSLSIW